MRLFLTLLMAIFMTLGPVTSLVAQINQEIPFHAMQIIDEPSQQESNTDKHSCCEDQCECSYQNECDIQQLSFFAILPQSNKDIAGVTPLTMLVHAPIPLQSSPEKHYRPPIINL